VPLIDEVASCSIAAASRPIRDPRARTPSHHRGALYRRRARVRHLDSLGRTPSCRQGRESTLPMPRLHVGRIRRADPRHWTTGHHSLSRPGSTTRFIDDESSSAFARRNMNSHQRHLTRRRVHAVRAGGGEMRSPLTAAPNRRYLAGTRSFSLTETPWGRSSPFLRRAATRTECSRQVTAPHPSKTRSSRTVPDSTSTQVCPLPHSHHPAATAGPVNPHHFALW
jgi:hypothetical protein